MPEPEVQDSQHELDLKEQAKREAEAASDFMQAIMKPFMAGDGSSAGRPSGKA